MVKDNGHTGALSPEALAHFKTYKYSSVDKSLISNNILRHYWNACVQLLPPWLAPNMVTLLGFFFVLGNVIILEIVDPDLVGDKPSWIYFSFAAGLWMYSTMDNIDGRQARRTGTSSGLGELFDHGIDSLNCTLASLLELSAMSLGPTRLGALTALVPTLPMFFSTWETYHTHTLYLGYFNGPTEGLILACSSMIISGLYGPGVWSNPLAEIVGFKNVLGDLSVKDIWAPMLIAAIFLAHLPECISNVARARREKNLSVAPVFLEWTPMIIFTASLIAWLGSPHSHLLMDNHLALLSITMSFVFGRMTTKIILAHLTHQPFPYWTMMLAPLIGGAVLVNLPLFGLEPVDANFEHRFLQAYLIYALILYFRWATVVINAICDHLGIPCLTVPEEKWKAVQASEKAAANGSVAMNGVASGKGKPH